MEAWAVAVVSALLCFVSASFLLRRRAARPRRLPPGPPPLPVIGNLLLFLRSGGDFASVLEKLFSEYGPIISVYRRALPTIVVADRDVAHEMLVQNGAVFADRPPQSPALRLLTADRCQVSAAEYGPRWRLLRRNLVSEMARARQSAGARGWALGALLDELRGSAGAVVAPKEAIQYAMFCLLVFLCFGERLDEKTVRAIEKAQRDLLLFFQKLAVFEYAPRITRYLFWGRWRRLLRPRQRQREIFLPLIRSRRQKKKSAGNSAEEEEEEKKSLDFCYLDSVLDLEMPERDGGAATKTRGRKLDDEEILSLCSEFLNAGTDTTSTALEWIMANIAANPDVQERVAGEVGGEGSGASEEELERKPYLKAVILEGLRRHPPGHFVLPHAVTEEVVVRGGYAIPKGAAINFAVGKMGRDAGVWADPLEFRPERFLPGGDGHDADITGNRKIDMMPFGAGRRICPGMALALLHLEFFVANLVREFVWEPVDHRPVDLSEKPEFTVVMKNPLRCRISPRSKNT
ncbi:cytochrome P450 89A2-like [Wolffia australiana]